jgi:O-antigen/teichoic acid export membrane protein
MPALVQTGLRATAFRDGRERGAVLAETAWLGIFVVGVVIGPTNTVTQVLAYWGMGAVAAALLLFKAALKPRLGGFVPSFRWLWTDASLLGRWLIGEGLIFVAGSFAMVAGLTAIAGTSAFGGFRAIESAFSPFSLIAPAITLVALPRLALAASEPVSAARYALSLSFVAAAASLAYTFVMALNEGLVSRIFGEQFDQFQSLIIPIGLTQAVLAVALGPTLVLKSHGRGGTLFLSRAVAVALTLVLSLSLAASYGITAAAWGVAVGSIFGSGMYVLLSWRVATEAQRSLGDARSAVLEAA